MLERLGQVIKKATDKIANAIFLDKNLVDTIIRDLQRALIEADINTLLVKELTDKIKKTALDERIKEIEKKEHIIKLLHDKLINILGEYKPLKLKKEKNIILFLGLYGVGKTTTIAKLGNYFAKRGNKVALVGLDVHRPAASEQLKQLAEKNKLNYFIDLEEKDALKIWENNKKELEKYNLILVDTAGRHMLDKELLNEIKSLSSEIKPTESILVMPADIGQAAKKQAKEFKDVINISGVIITRMDSTAKAGGALTACAETQASVYFIGTGEKINDIEEFNPERFLSRLLGMGDLESLIEKIKSATGKDEQEKMQKALESGKLSLQDVIEQVKSMNSLGGFDKIKSMVPGLGNAKIPENALENQETKIAKWEHILKSMTKQEKENPDLLKDSKTGNSRINRIAKGAGVANSDIRSLIKQYDMLNEMIKSQTEFDPEKGMSQKQMMKMAKKFMKGKKLKF
ncbi:MAG: signal recognition particle receptor subunit alpha [Nanoarchaeota archaeon]|nr:signal recognition particle receptor subunit alpha [Nanoarchaeota archaeon]MBU1028229.1 signal recognition particle receptor subunit alpha [Nanoarchaeota archaeon]